MLYVDVDNTLTLVVVTSDGHGSSSASIDDRMLAFYAQFMLDSS